LASGKEIFAHKLVLSARNKSWGFLESGSMLGKGRFSLIGLLKISKRLFSQIGLT